MSEFGLLGLPTDELATFLLGAHNDPFRVLGAHRLADDLVIRVFRPDAKEVEIVLLSDDGDQFLSDAANTEQRFLPRRTSPKKARLQLSPPDHTMGWG